MAVKTLGMREFRENFSEYLSSEEPIEVTKHGTTVGYYIPTHKIIEKADQRSLEEASRVLNELIKEKGLNSEDLIKEAQSLRSEEGA